MEFYQAFMVAERKNRILKNNERINEIKSEIQNIKNTNNVIISKLNELKSEYLKVKEQLINLEQDYKEYNDEKFLDSKSNRIQSLCESIKFKEEQIQFTNCLNKSNRMFRFFNGLSRFYKYKNNIEKEENNQKASFVKTTFNYLKQYTIFKKNRLFNKSKSIPELISKYKLEKENMVLETNELSEQLNKRRKCLRTYPENKELSIKKIIEISNEAKRLKSLINYNSYKQKRDIQIKLEKENEAYQAQVNGLIELNNVQDESQVELQEEKQNGKIIKFKICA